MRPISSVSLITLSLFSSTALAAPGHSWEVGMEMEGLPFASPKQKICGPKDSKEPPVSREDDGCQILEKKQSGNRFQWTAQCKDGLMSGDITSTPTSYSGIMKMTEKGGPTTTMKIFGKRLGDCEYRDRTPEIKAMQKQSEALVGNYCQNALAEMHGQLLGNQCPKEKALFCQRLATTEGYDQATRNLPAEVINDSKIGAPSLTGLCRLDNSKLLPRLCASAVAESNYNFVSRLCPAERPRLCAAAASAGQVDYVGAHCPNEKAALITQYCEGRGYTRDIAPRFAAFCANAAMSGEIQRGSAPEPASAAPAEPAATQGDQSIQQGIRQLRGLFGF